jgi:hypothetical protein
MTPATVAQTQTPAEIKLSIINSATGEPVSGALVIFQHGPPRPAPGTDDAVRVRALQSPRPPIRAVTDATGKLAFPLGDAMYAQVTVSRRGFRGPNGEDSIGTTIRPDSASNTIVELVPLSAIEGQVVNEDGEPLPGITVQALQVNILQGRRTTREHASVSTNDLGRYRLFNVTPGVYYIKALGRRGVYSALGGVPQLSASEESYGPAYYPRGSSMTEAQTVRMQPGQTVRANFAMEARKAYKIRGVVRNMLSGVTPNVRLTRGSEVFGNRCVVDHFSGAFEVSDVVPGVYTIQAYATNGTLRVFGEVSATIGPQDLTGVVLMLSSGVDVTGTVELPPAAGDSRPGRRYVSVMATPDSPDRLPFEGRVFASIGNDGLFTLENVLPGSYMISLTTGEGAGYVSSIWSGSTDVLANGLVVGTSPPAQLKIVLSPGGGTIKGKVTGLTAGSSATVIIADSRHAAVPPIETWANPLSGEFTSPKLAPGFYSVYAFKNVSQVEYQNRDVLTGLAKASVAVTIQEGATETVSIAALEDKP